MDLKLIGWTIGDDVLEEVEVSDMAGVDGKSGYPQYKSGYIKRVTCEDSYAQSIITDFKQPDKEPFIAVSVDSSILASTFEK